MNERAMKRLEQICADFAKGCPVDTIAALYEMKRETVEAVIRQAMKLADRKGATGSGGGR